MGKNEVLNKLKKCEVDLKKHFFTNEKKRSVKTQKKTSKRNE